MESLYVLFWVDIALIGILMLIFWGPISRILQMFRESKRKKPPTEMLMKLQQYLSETTHEEFKKDWTDAGCGKSKSGPTAKELIESFNTASKSRK